MIATCTECGKMFETSYEDASRPMYCCPPVLCVKCYKEAHPEPIEPDGDDGMTPQQVADEDFRRWHPHDGDTE